MNNEENRLAEEIRKLHAGTEQHHLDLVPMIRELPPMMIELVDFTPVLREIERIAQAVNGDMGTLEEVLGEIGKVQQALYIDYFRKADRTRTVRGSLTTGEAAKVIQGEVSGSLTGPEGFRVREFFTQTDSVETRDAEMLTDPIQLEKPPKPKDHMSHQQSSKFKERQSIVRPETEAMKKKKPKNVIDGDAMKQKMREALIKGEYNVHDYYHDSGCSQKIAKSWLFEQSVFFVIFLNCIWIAVDTDHNHESVLVDSDLVFQVAENCFCTFFTLELMIRFLAFKKKVNCLKDFWFVFDSLLLFFMVGETWVISVVVLATKQDGGGFLGGNLSMLRMVRMVKMFRMARMARFLRSVPELVVLIKTIGVASRSVFFFFLFWLIIIYVFSIAFRQMTKGTDIGDLYFESVPEAMNNLFIHGLLPAQSDFVNELSTSNPYLWPCIIAFILLASLTVMNMLVGVLVEVVGVVASTEKEKMSVLGVKHDMQDAMEYLGVDHNEALSQDQFVKILMNPEMLNVIQGLGVDPFALMEVTEHIFTDLEKEAEAKGEKNVEAPGLSFQAFIDILLKMRGKNPATVKDVNEHTRVMKSLLSKLEETVTSSRKILGRDIQMLMHDLNKDDDDARSTVMHNFLSGMGTRDGHTSDGGSIHDGDDEDEPRTGRSVGFRSVMTTSFDD